MSHKPGVNEPGLTGFARAEAITEAAGALGAEVFRFAEDLSAASHASLEATQPPIIGTGLEESWPLNLSFSIHQLLISRSSQRLKNYGLLAVSLPKDPSPDMMRALAVESSASLQSDKYDDETLAEVYGSDNPRLGFVRHLVQWADEMAQQGWPTFVRVNVGTGSRVGVSVYEGHESVKDYLHLSTDASRISEEDAEVGTRPSVWVSQRVIISGDEQITAALIDSK